MVTRYDRGYFKSKAVKTDEGYLFDIAAITRTGVLPYRNDDGSMRYELRHPEDVFAEDSLASAKLIPVTNTHPQPRADGGIHVDDISDAQIGTTGEQVFPEDRYVMASLKVTKSDGVKAIDAGRKELSCGYNCDLEEVSGTYDGVAYTHRQRNIKYNHVAIVDRGRAGPTVRLNVDSAEEFMKTIHIDGIAYEAPPEVAVALEKEKALRADEAKTLTTVQAKLDALTAEFEKSKKAHADALATLPEKVKARVALEKIAAAHIDGDLSSKSDREIKEAVILKVSTNAKLDGATDDYISARFDAAIEFAGETDTAISEQRKATTAQPGARSDSKDPRTEAIAAVQNMWKREGAK